MWGRLQRFLQHRLLGRRLWMKDAATPEASSDIGPCCGKLSPGLSSSIQAAFAVIPSACYLAAFISVQLVTQTKAVKLSC